ncbi:dihydrolipoyl dehydrogenase family protein [Schaalia vaccimaxillae]|uniref:dihydrolipoyl dehydrogenase family protein n=1 Tax=Schaalia vaccimaxillae TaxID=183916 RepID=UPI0003B384F0|nr:FAD-dependent oxidoreductase [Schaalia vaccimaxillae]
MPELVAHSAPVATHSYDLIVIGGGKAGKSLAMNRAAAGWRVAMIERQYIGGTCINVACIPTKTLVTSARRLLEAQSNDEYGVVGTDTARIDLAGLRERKEGVVGAMVGAHEKMFAADGLDFMRGNARLESDRWVSVDLEDGSHRRIHAERILLNVGSRPSLPPIEGLSEVGAWTNEDILRLESLPKSLAIIGGGYIGVEFASMMSIFGVDVTVISSSDHVLPREDADIAGVVEDGLASQGVTIVHGVRAESVSRKNNQTTVVLSDGSSVTADELLVATGRTPNTDGLGLEEAGVSVDDRGFIIVNEHLRTSVEGVWAAGDAAGSPMFTHASWNDFRVIRAQFEGADLSDPQATTRGRLIPYSVFTTPELARIGLSEEDAHAEGHDVLVASIPVAQVPRAKTLGHTEGVWKAVVDAQTHRILGMTLVGPESSEVISVVQVAMAAQMTAQQLRYLPFSHPTMAEGLQILLDQFKF